MPWGLIGAAAIGAVSSAIGARSQNQAAKAAAQKQMDFQKETLQNQYQWGMADMRKAGLNPILAYKQGGAGSAGGSSYSPVNVGAAAATGAGAGATSAMSFKRYNLEKMLTAQNIRTLEEQAYKNLSDGNLSRQLRRNAMEQNDLLQQQKLMNQPSVNSAHTASKFFKTPAGKRAVVLDLLGRSINPLTSATGRRP